MKRKGFFTDMAYAIVTAIIIVTIAMIGINSIIDVDDIIRLNTVDMAGQRLEGAIYATDAIKQGEVEVKYQADYTLKETSSDNIILEYEYVTLSKDAPIDPPVDFEITDNGTSQRFCIVKETASTVEVTPGGCSG